MLGAGLWLDSSLLLTAYAALTAAVAKIFSL
jgi:uncharacterized membrane-anchored protein